jgi:hypothetical protein
MSEDVKIEKVKEEKAVETIRERLRRRNACPRCGSKPCDLAISRVPENTLKWFKEEFATQEDFCQDWGMAFRSLCEGYRRLQQYEGNTIDTESLIGMIEQLKLEVELLKQQLVKSKEEKPQVKTMLSGRKIRIGMGGK